MSDAAHEVDDARAVARQAGLHYVDTAKPGITRQRRGKGFSYAAADGTAVRDAEERARIAALAIPPAWSDVWISADPKGHVLATGRDDRGRKQYRYHPRWRAVRDADKFARMAWFSAALPDLRATVEADLGQRGLPRRKVVALVVRLLDDTLIRVGNPEYAADNESYGLTTLQHTHVTVEGDRLAFDFVGKSGVSQQVEVHDPRLARIAKRCHELPGQQLFAYLDDDRAPAAVSSADVNDYLRDAMGPGVSAKDFRTWGGTTVAGAALALTPVPATKAATEQSILAAYDIAATVLGNTRAVCRSCYVHPVVPESFPTGALLDAWNRSRAGTNLSRPERAVRHVLEDAAT